MYLIGWIFPPSRIYAYRYEHYKDGMPTNYTLNQLGRMLRLYVRLLSAGHKAMLTLLGLCPWIRPLVDIRHLIRHREEC